MFGRPIRTLLSVVFATLLAGVVYIVAFRSTAALAALDAAGDAPLAVAAAVLPPLWILLLIGLAIVVLVPISSVLSGVGHDRRYRYRH